MTDANVLLGYMNPDYLVGGELKLNAAKARAVFAEKIAEPLGLSVEHAAYGAHRIAASNMIRAIKSVSTERGRDPRGYTLFAFGGSGPIFGAAMARELGMKRVVVPPSPGVFSSFGLLYAEVAHHYSRTFRRLLRKLDLAELNRVWDGLVAEASDQLAADGFAEAARRISRTANLHYQGQTFELTVPVPEGAIDAVAVAALEEAFGAEHERTYGHRAGSDEPVELVNIQVVGAGVSARAGVPERLSAATARQAEPPAPRQAYFGPAAGWLETPILGRADLKTPHPGPCVVEEYDATVVIPPDSTAALDAYGNILIELQ